jgi:flagellin-specific chaperone FliS
MCLSSGASILTSLHIFYDCERVYDLLSNMNLIYSFLSYELSLLSLWKLLPRQVRTAWFEKQLIES